MAIWPGASRGSRDEGGSPVRLGTQGRLAAGGRVNSARDLGCGGPAVEVTTRQNRLSAEVALIAHGEHTAAARRPGGEAPMPTYAPPPTYSRPAESQEMQIQQLKNELHRERLKNEELLRHGTLVGAHANGQRLVDPKAYDLINDQLRQLKLDNNRLCHEVDVLRVARQSSHRNRSSQNSPRASPRSSCSTSTPRGPHQEGWTRVVEQLQGEKDAALEQLQALAQEVKELRAENGRLSAAGDEAGAEISRLSALGDEASSSPRRRFSCTPPGARRQRRCRPLSRPSRSRRPRPRRRLT